jgi:hypothetical protein
LIRLKSPCRELGRLFTFNLDAAKKSETRNFEYDSSNAISPLTVRIEEESYQQTGRILKVEDFMALCYFDDFVAMVSNSVQS